MSDASDTAGDVDPMRVHKRMRMLMFIGVGAWAFVGAATAFAIPSYFDISEKLTFVVLGVGLICVYGLLASIKFGLEARREYRNHE